MSKENDDKRKEKQTQALRCSFPSKKKDFRAAKLPFFFSRFLLVIGNRGMLLSPCNKPTACSIYICNSFTKEVCQRDRRKTPNQSISQSGTGAGSNMKGMFSDPTGNHKQSGKLSECLIGCKDRYVSKSTWKYKVAREKCKYKQLMLLSNLCIGSVSLFKSLVPWGQGPSAEGYFPQNQLHLSSPIDRSWCVKKEKKQSVR